MKKILLASSLIAFISSEAQKIVKDKKDDFDGSRLIQTSDENLRGNILKNYCAVTGFIKLTNKPDTTFALAFYFMAPSTTSIDDKKNVYLKLSNDSILIFKNLTKYNIAAKDELMDAAIILSQDDMKQIIVSGVKMMRIETSEENVDIAIDEKRISVIPSILSLMKNYKL